VSKPDPKRRPRCPQCTSLRKDLRSLKQRNKELNTECDELHDIVEAGSKFLQLLVKYIDDGEN